MPNRARRLLAALLAAVCLGRSLRAQAPVSSWRVVWEQGVDSVLLAGLDTATTEGGWCLEVDTVQAARVVILRSARAPWQLRTFGDSTIFSCPLGAAIAHRHLVDRGHTAGPTSGDYRALGVTVDVGDGRARWLKLYLLGVVIIRRADERPQLAVYGLPASGDGSPVGRVAHDRIAVSPRERRP